MDLVGLLGSAVGGSIFGMIGAALKVVGGIWEAKQKMAERQLEMTHEIALIEKQSQLRVIESENERAITQLRADADIKTKSYEVYTDLSNTYKWVASVVALVRPALTLFLWMLAAWSAWTVMQDRGQVLVNGKDLMADIINNITFCAAAATLWWFGDRPSQKR